MYSWSKLCFCSLTFSLSQTALIRQRESNRLRNKGINGKSLRQKVDSHLLSQARSSVRSMRLIDKVVPKGFSFGEDFAQNGAAATFYYLTWAFAPASFAYIYCGMYLNGSTAFDLAPFQPPS